MKSKIVNGLLGLTKQVSRNAGFVLAVLYTVVPGTAKSADIPLVLVQLYDKDGTAFYRLGINVGIGSGKPKTYLFDTGSSLFNAAYSPAWWPSSITPTTARLATSVKYKYGDKNSITEINGENGSHPLPDEIPADNRFERYGRSTQEQVVG